MQEEPAANKEQLDRAYAQMSQDQQRESEALEWAGATLGDVGDEDA